MREHEVSAGIPFPANASAPNPTYACGAGHWHWTGEETNMTLPTLTPEQRAEALEKAAAARSQRARIKSELKSGELKLSEFFAASESDEVITKIGRASCRERV